MQVVSQQDLGDDIRMVIHVLCVVFQDPGRFILEQGLLSQWQPEN